MLSRLLSRVCPASMLPLLGTLTASRISTSAFADGLLGFCTELEPSWSRSLPAACNTALGARWHTTCTRPR